MDGSWDCVVMFAWPCMMRPPCHPKGQGYKAKGHAASRGPDESLRAPAPGHHPPRGENSRESVRGQAQASAFPMAHAAHTHIPVCARTHTFRRKKEKENGKIIHRGGNQQPAVRINPKLDKRSLFWLVPQSEKIHSFAARMRALSSMMENEKRQEEEKKKSPQN